MSALASQSATLSRTPIEWYCGYTPFELICSRLVWCSKMVERARLLPSRMRDKGCMQDAARRESRALRSAPKCNSPNHRQSVRQLLDRLPRSRARHTPVRRSAEALQLRASASGVRTTSFTRFSGIKASRRCSLARRTTGGVSGSMSYFEPSLFSLHSVGLD